MPSFSPTVTCVKKIKKCYSIILQDDKANFGFDLFGRKRSRMFFELSK